MVCYCTFCLTNSNGVLHLNLDVSLAVGDSVLDCLERLGLTETLALLEESDFANHTNFGQMFTLFAPTNAAIEAVRDELDMMNSAVVVGNHIVGRALKEEDLTFNQRFQTLANLTIHSTTVVFGHRTLYNYNPHYGSNSQSNSIRYTTVSFKIPGTVCT